MKPLHLPALWIAFALTGLIPGHADPTNALSAPARPGALSDVDGRPVQIPVPGKATVVLYTKPDAEEQARLATQALDEFAGNMNFRYIVIADFRVADASARDPIKKEVRANLDDEAKRLRPFYRKNKNSGNPRVDLVTIADFDGSAAAAVGWPAPSDSVRVVIFDAAGHETKRFDRVDSAKALKAEVKAVVPSP